jgi:hypothetical protein
MQCDLLTTRTRCHWRFNPLLDAGNFRSKHFLKSFRIIPDREASDHNPVEAEFILKEE